MNRRTFLKWLGTGAAAVASPWVGLGAEGHDRRKPNIICILVDDLGIGDVSCFGSDQFKTPHIDALAKGGMRFERCFATPLCGPSRCQLLTGQYPFRTGLVSNQSAQAISPKKQVMIPTVMKQAGYITASVGKWGQMSLGPKEWGFDEHLVFRGSGKYWASQGGGYTVNGAPKTLGEKEYLPDAMHDFVVDFLRRQKERPFVLYYSMSHIHGPILKTPDSKAGSDYYGDNVAYMDKLVGKLVDALDRLKLRENTLIVFLGDNGTARFGADKASIGGKFVSGAKGSMWEGGSLVPMIVNWPRVSPAGKVYRDLVDFSDMLPTFAEVGGAALPKDRVIDGRSFAGRLKGEAGNPREWVYVELGGKRYVREDQWKLTGAGELFDMKGAPFVEARAEGKDGEAAAARERLEKALVGLVGKEKLGGDPGMDKPPKNGDRAAKRAARQVKRARGG